MLFEYVLDNTTSMYGHIYIRGIPLSNAHMHERKVV